VSTTTVTPPVEVDKGRKQNWLAAGFHRLYYGQTRFEFVRRKKIWFIASSVVILAGVVSLAVRGLNFDIEFVGGTSWQVPANGVTVNQIRSAIAPYGIAGATVTVLGSGKNAQIQVEAKVAQSSKALKSTNAATATVAQNDIARALAKATHHTSIKSVTVQQVGPTWGSQITNKAIIALIVFLVVIAIYISLFFEWRMALAAIIAVLHDILVTVGIYSLSGFLVTPDTVVAVLTILGYSLYDTIVVFDRVRDNTKGLGSSGKITFTDVVNLSMNQTLARSINTSLVAILPILAVLILGADILGATTLQYFGLALLIGLTSGAYSSIFIASPLVAMLKEREPRYVQIRRKLESRGQELQLLSPAAVAAGLLDDSTGEKPSARRRRRGAPSAPRQSGPIRPKAGAQKPIGDTTVGSEAQLAEPLSGSSEEWTDGDVPVVGLGPDGRVLEELDGDDIDGVPMSAAIAPRSQPGKGRALNPPSRTPASGGARGSQNRSQQQPRPRKKRRR
jgi:preprotein translocase subunit SecF